MSPTFEQRDAFWLLGVQHRVDMSTGSDTYRSIWDQDFMAHHDELMPLSTTGWYYGASYEADSGDACWDYLAAMPVPPDIEPPAGLVLREVPAGRYARFACTVATIGETYGYIHGQWSQQPGIKLRGGAPVFEEYPPETASDPSAMAILVPVEN